VTKNRIYHMASFSRSGETLMQRCLNAHPDIEVVHQINEPDTPADLKIFRSFMQREKQTIAADDPLVLHRKLGENAVLLLKNAVWIHPYPRQGFTLVRNPFSLVASSYRENPPPDQAKRQRAQQARWARGIDLRLLAMMQGGPTLPGFLALYTRKMLQDRRDGLPFVRYEDFVLDPEAWLRKIVAHLGLPWSDRVLTSHEGYPVNKKGHGGIKLWTPVNPGSVNKYKSLSDRTLSKIYGMTHEVLAQYGYSWDGAELGCQEAEGLL